MAMVSKLGTFLFVILSFYNNFLNLHMRRMLYDIL